MVTLIWQLTVLTSRYFLWANDEPTKMNVTYVDQCCHLPWTNERQRKREKTPSSHTPQKIELELKTIVSLLMSLSSFSFSLPFMLYYYVLKHLFPPWNVKRFFAVKINNCQPRSSPRTPSTPSTPGATAGPMFQFTDPSLNRRAATVKDQLLQWCQRKTMGYEVPIYRNLSSKTATESRYTLSKKKTSKHT